MRESANKLYFNRLWLCYSSTNFDIFGAYMSYTQRTAVLVLSCYTRKHIVEVRKVLGLRAKSALGSYEKTHVAEICKCVHKKRGQATSRGNMYANTYGMFLLLNRLTVKSLAPPLSLLVPPTARRRRLSTVARSLPKPSFWYIIAHKT